MLCIGWLLAFMMIIGFMFIKSCEKFANDQEANDSLRLGADAIIQDYNSRNLGGRISLILYFAITLLTGGN